LPVLLGIVLSACPSKKPDPYALSQFALHLFMVRRVLKFLLFFAMAYDRLDGLAAQTPDISRIWTVKDGLPQSFISGMCQDNDGFLWIATLNGFCRCDGRTFKYYRHTYADGGAIGGNIILQLFDAGNDQLLLCYMDGRIELFNTVTEGVTPLWKDKTFDVLRPEAPYFKSLIHDDRGICWMMADDGGIFRLDLSGHSVTHFTLPGLQLHEPVLGLCYRRNSLLLFTKTELSVRDSTGRQVKAIPYPFRSLNTFGTAGVMVYSPGIRDNGDLIIPDSGGIKIWNIEKGFSMTVPFPRIKRRSRLIAQFDQAGNYYFESDDGMYLLRPDNRLIKWPLPDPAVEGLLTSICIDQSGVLWAGTNGYGLRQYNLSMTGMHGYRDRSTFVIDVLSHYGSSPSPARTPETFLNRSVAFANRCVSFKDSIWIVDVNQLQASPTLALFTHNRVSVLTFHNEEARSENPALRKAPQAQHELHKIIFLAFTRKGSLWGIDQHFFLVRFDLRRHSFRVFPRPVQLDPGEELNGMTADGESSFYITTTQNLVRADTLGQTDRLTSLLPTKELLTVSKDHDDDNILWIGTLSDGLIRLDRTTRQTQVFSIATGLPNNTIYSVVEGDDHRLWCSSNKGIFAFDKQLHSARSFTSRDGLIDDEFNRFYYISLPDGHLAFGGPMGYTIFDPLELKTDNFDPSIVLTGLSIINRPRQYALLRTLSELDLPHDQNSITAEFAAMQFDFPEKLQYRYMLEGFDKTWVLAGNENKAYYTSLPPGNYTLLLNASNTSGKWSSHIRRIRIMITPPFWQTWWFYTTVLLFLGLLVYSFLQLRIRRLKKAHRQQLHFERQAMELHAMALRARMNPHFIFNCLNSIKALIQEKEDKKAISYLTSFVVLIRKQLNNTSDRISLREELDTCRLYLQLEAMRFDGRIAYEFDIADTVQPEQIMVPPLILQLVVENAVVHGLIPLEEGGLVRIGVYREGRYTICSIEDNGIGRVASGANRRRSSPLHESRGVQMLEERIRIHNRLNERAGSIGIADLYGPGGQPSGTRVILKFDSEL
jgi:ligand-binding sensor domain-containing protein